MRDGFGAAAHGGDADADGLVPELRRRGLTRTGYTCEHFRDNLLEF